jgi:hypothetical protein
VANPEHQFVMCVRNEAFPASLEVHKIYLVLADSEAASHQMLRVVDESGEDYLYPAELFTPVELPQVARELFLQAS